MMGPNQSDERRRSLECDRRFSAALCMSAATILANRVAAGVPRAAALFEPHGASQAVAPIIFLGAMIGSTVAAIIASDGGRRVLAGLGLVAGAALLATTVPFAHQMLRSFAGNATPSWTAAAVAFVAFGINAGFAVREMKPSANHARMSAVITVFALFMAATDGSGVFSGILAAMGLLFFTRYRDPATQG